MVIMTATSPTGILLGKLAFITGAGSGIGRATCQVLAREGAQIIAADTNEQAATQTVNSLSSSNHLSLKVNVFDTNSIKNSIENTLNHFKRSPNVIVNCAGITRDNFLLRLSEEDFDEVIKVNLKGTFLILKAFATILEENKVENGSIINLASISAKIGNVGQCNYTASKAGVEALTKTAARELSKLGIRCNTVFPGFIATPMTDTVPDKVKAKIISGTALKRLGKPEEVAEVIAFLASDRSSYITGASIDVTGGL